MSIYKGKNGTVFSGGLNFHDYIEEDSELEAKELFGDRYGIKQKYLYVDECNETKSDDG